MQEVATRTDLRYCACANARQRGFGDVERLVSFAREVKSGDFVSDEGRCDGCSSGPFLLSLYTAKVLSNPTDIFRGVTVGSMGTTSQRRTRDRKPRLVGENLDDSRQEDDAPDEERNETNAEMVVKLKKPSSTQIYHSSGKKRSGSTAHCAPERVVHARWDTGTFFRLLGLTNFMLHIPGDVLDEDDLLLSLHAPGTQSHALNLFWGRLKSFVYETLVATLEVVIRLF
ncbi:hypothetical protein TNCV_4686381 [Trichonephila clavipes]|nr:hypothetical protein TNCV_4686381 [Trichonephila clavipes]